MAKKPGAPRRVKPKVTQKLPPAKAPSKRVSTRERKASKPAPPETKSPKPPSSQTKKPTPSKPKSTPRKKAIPKAKSAPSPKPSEKSRNFLKSAFSKPNLTALPLTPSGKTLKTAIGKQVIYGIREKRNGKTVIRKLDMAPQLFRKADLESLNSLVNRSATAQESREPKLAFFQTKVEGEFERTKTGRVKTHVVKAGPLKGQRVPVYKTEMRFDVPPPGSEWRQLFYNHNKFSHAIQKNLQTRNTYEVVRSEMLGKEGFTAFKEAHSRFAGGYEIRDVTLKGRTLTEALRQIQVPVSSLWLKDKKVILEKFRDNQIGNIFVKGTVNVTSKGNRFDIPIEISARYLTDLPNEIGRAIRQRLADKGSTFTTPRELAAIEQGAWRKLKALRGGLKTERARRELSRLTQPGLNPKAPKLKAALERIAKGKQSGDDFPLSVTDEVNVNLRFSFYRDPLAKDSKKKKGTRKKRGTKK